MKGTYAEYTEAAIEAANATRKLIIGFTNLGKIQRRFDERATRYNHGRARKVSFQRPSPQMSRKRLDEIWNEEGLAEPLEWSLTPP